MREFQHTVTARDGVQLFVRECVPDVSTTRRNLLVLHGVCEHGGRYSEFSQAATAAGWRVLIPDHRGHGRSTGVRVHVSSFDQYLDDLRLHCRHFSLDPKCTAIVGHSMGGLIAALMLEQPERSVNAACLLAPCFRMRVHVDRFTLALGKILSVIWPTYHFRSRVRAADLSQDEDYLQRRRQDLLIERAVTASWFFAMQRALLQVHAEIARIQQPLLILQGDQDQVVDPQATQAWFESLNVQDRTLDMLPGHLHELLQEPDRVVTTDRILRWLDERVPK